MTQMDAKWNGAPRDPRGADIGPKSHPKSTKMLRNATTQTINKDHRKKHPRNPPKRTKFGDLFDPKTTLNQISAD